MPSVAVVAGLLAIRENRRLPYVQCVVSYVMLLFLLLWCSTGMFPLFEVVVLSCMLGTGTMLAIASLWRGHWLTKIFAAISLAAFLFILNVVVRRAILRWDIIVLYWTS